jgi:protein TonB
MSNYVLLPPDENQGPSRQNLRPLDKVILHGDLSATEKGAFASLYQNILDFFFPAKLPPLVLTSQPVPVVDRMAVKRDPVSVAISVVVNVSLLALMIWFGHRVITNPPAKIVNPISLDVPPPPLKIAPKTVVMGGGGGQKGPAPVTKGSPPKFAPQQLNPPKIKVDDALLHPPSTVNVQPMKMAQTNLPNFGMPNAANVGVSMGNGNGTGIGSGNGNGIGPGSGGNMGGGVRRVGGGVSDPVVLYNPEPEFSEEARKAKVAGNVLVYLQVDQTGHPTHVHVIRPLGMGLDEKAVEAVRQWRFKPAMENGHPVTVEINVEVNFQIF